MLSNGKWSGYTLAARVSSRDVCWNESCTHVGQDFECCEGIDNRYQYIVKHAPEEALMGVDLFVTMIFSLIVYGRAMPASLASVMEFAQLR